MVKIPSALLEQSLPNPPCPLPSPLNSLAFGGDSSHDAVFDPDPIFRQSHDLLLERARHRGTSDMNKAVKVLPTSPAPCWRVSWLLAAPHRLGFFAGAVMMALSSLWWSGALLAKALSLPIAWAVAPSVAHSLFMSLGFMPFFFAGFLFTAGPKWLRQREVAARSICAPIAWMLLGWCIVLAGFHLQDQVAGAGLVLVALGWSRLCLRLAVMVRRSSVVDRVHPTLIVFSCCTGAVMLWIAAVAMLLQYELVLRSAIQLALWCFVVPVFAVASHRLIPFFGASASPLLDAWHPLWLLWLMVGVLWLEAPLAAIELWWRPLPAQLRWGQAIVEAYSGMVLLGLAVRWALVQNLKNRLLAMLHEGFMWLGLSFALAAISHALMALTHSELSLGLAPLHAMTMGYLGSTLLAMATRVSSGFGGRTNAADTRVWVLYWVLQAAVLLRVFAALWPLSATLLTLLAALAWSIATVGWAFRYGRWFGRPRIDGRPG